MGGPHTPRGTTLTSRKPRSDAELSARGCGPLRKSDRPWNPEIMRARIKAEKLIDRLQNNAMGKLKKELSLGQVRSIEVLLRKIVPDVMQTQINAAIEHRYVVEIPSVLAKDQWLKKYNSTPTLNLPNASPSDSDPAQQ